MIDITTGNTNSATAELIPRKSKFRRQIVFRTFCVLFPALLVASAELVLYGLGVGTDTRLVIASPHAGEGNVFSFNMQADLAYTNINLRGPEPRSFELPKPASTFRVVVIGESSVQGYPFPSELAFPRQLELILGRQLPSKEIEVLNAGIVGLSTTPLVDITRQAVSADPDLVIVYAGHNEFYGIGGEFAKLPLGHIGIELRRFRLMQLLFRMTSSTEESSEALITRLSNEIVVPPDSARRRRAEETYRANLTAILQICEKANVPILVCSVVANLHDQSPIVSHSSLGSTDARIRDRHLESARRAVEVNKHGPALKELDQAELLDPKFALTSFRKAQSLDALNRLDDAAVFYSSARDLDGSPFRAPNSFRDIARESVETSSAKGVHFVDIVQMFVDASEGRSPGRELFTEHVHFTLDGHWLVARTIARKVVEEICHQKWNAKAVPSTEERDDWLGLIPLDQLSAAILTSFIVQSAPLNKAADANLQLRILNTQIQKLAGEVSPEDMQLFTKLDHQTKVDDLLQGLGQLKLDNRDPKGALELFERAQRRRPWMPHSFVYSAICHHLLGDNNQARADLRKSYGTVIVETERLKRIRSALMEKLR